MKNKTYISLITAILCVSMIALPVHKPKAVSIAGGLCLIVVAVVVGGAVVVTVKNCSPQYYCIFKLTDPEQGYWVGTCTRRELILNDWGIASGPYKSVALATANCPPPTNSTSSLTVGMKMTDLTSKTREDFMALIVIEKSTNMVDWFKVDQFMDIPNDLNWSQTNSLDEATAFYRVRY